MARARCRACPAHGLKFQHILAGGEFPRPGANGEGRRFLPSFTRSKTYAVRGECPVLNFRPRKGARTTLGGHRRPPQEPPRPRGPPVPVPRTVRPAQAPAPHALRGPNNHLRGRRPSLPPAHTLCGASVNLAAPRRDRERVNSYVMVSDSSWQLGRWALDRISLSRSKIEFGLKHGAHLNSN